MPQIREIPFEKVHRLVSTENNVDMHHGVDSNRSTNKNGREINLIFDDKFRNKEKRCSDKKHSLYDAFDYYQQQRMKNLLCYEREQIFQGILKRQRPKPSLVIANPSNTVCGFQKCQPLSKLIPLEGRQLYKSNEIETVKQSGKLEDVASDGSLKSSSPLLEEYADIPEIRTVFESPLGIISLHKNIYNDGNGSECKFQGIKTFRRNYQLLRASSPSDFTDSINIGDKWLPKLDLSSITQKQTNAQTITSHRSVESLLYDSVNKYVRGPSNNIYRNKNEMNERRRRKYFEKNKFGNRSCNIVVYGRPPKMCRRQNADDRNRENITKVSGMGRRGLSSKTDCAVGATIDGSAKIIVKLPNVSFLYSSPEHTYIASRVNTFIK